MKKIGLVLAVLALAIGWAMYYALGTGIRWQDAYRALARADNEPPDGLPLEARLHAPSSLARVRLGESTKLDYVTDGVVPMLKSSRWITSRRLAARRERRGLQAIIAPPAAARARPCCLPGP